MELSKQNIDFVVCTLISMRGSAPQDPGAKAILTEKGLHWGTVGGGKIEMHAIQFAQTILANSQLSTPHLLTWNLQKDIGMSCGGEVTLLFEKFAHPQLQVAIFGAGHIAQALTRVLIPLDCHIHITDPRTEWIEKLPQAPNLYAHATADMNAVIQRLNPATFFVVMTQGHATDVPILLEIFKKYPKPSFVGVIGSNVKGRKIRSELLSLGASEEQVSLLHCPLGLPFGTNHPYEIALSVAGQIISKRDELVHENSKVASVQSGRLENDLAF